MRLVLVTRPLPACLHTAALLRANGHTPILAPMLHIIPLPGPLPNLPNLQAVLVTSANALPALHAFHTLPLFAVGDATAAHAASLGFTEIHSANGDAADLAHLCRTHLAPPGPLLLASGAGQGTPLAATLRAAGFTVHHHAVYEARPAATLPDAAATAWHQGRITHALFFSAATADAFTRAAPPAPAAHAIAIAIAAPAATALAPLPWRAIRVALTPTQEAMLALLP